MNNAIQDSDDRALHGKVLQTTIRVGLVVLLAFWSFKVFQPFIIPFMWGMIIAAAIHPPFFKLTEILGGRQSLAGILVVLLGLVLLIVPIILLSGTLVDGITILSDGFSRWEPCGASSTGKHFDVAGLWGPNYTRSGVWPRKISMRH